LSAAFPIDLSPGRLKSRSRPVPLADRRLKKISLPDEFGKAHSDFRTPAVGVETMSLSFAGKESKMQSAKSMVQVRGTTYRIARLSVGHYDVTRILDDVRIGSFWSAPALLFSESSQQELLREVARCAIKCGITSWVGSLHSS
jgi:hypothetical protein